MATTVGSTRRVSLTGIGRSPVVIAAVVELVDISSLRRLWRVRAGRVAHTYQLTARADLVAAAAALLAFCCSTPSPVSSS